MPTLASTRKDKLTIDSLLSKSKEELVQIILEKEGRTMPAGVLNSGFHPLQAVVKYLKEEERMEIKHISILLNRNVQTIWTSYNMVRDVKVSFKDSGIGIPLSVLSKTDCSILESAVHYLNSVHKLRLGQIAVMLGKSIKTVWTCNHRYMVKGGKK